MNNKSKLSNAILYGSLLAFIAFVVYILHLNQEVFYTAHDRSEFIFGAPFFHTLMSKPFGLMRYVGAWLTQLFVEPELGSTVLVAVWLLIFCVGAKAFRLQGSASALMLLPVACLLTSMVDLGYWIYVYPVRGYWFSQSVGYLVMLLLLWAARCTPRKWHLAWYVLGVCLYPVLGWFALLFVACLILFGKPSWRELLGIILLIVITSICHTQLFSYLRDDDVVMAGFPRFVTPIDNTPRLSLPFWVLGVISVLIPFGKKLADTPLTSYLLPLTSCIAGIIFTSSLMYYDKNYIDEMRMVRVACSDNWKEVLAMAEENKKPTSTMMFLKNIALMNEGGLLDRSFKLGNDAMDIYNPDSVHVSLLDIASPLVYYNYGMMNEAIRLSYENAIQAGFSPFYLKMLARCALACGDQKLLERYTTLIHKMPFYGNWQPAPVTEKVKELQKSYPDEITGVERSDSYLVNSISLWYKSDSKVASEQALLYAMLRCDSRRFWESLRSFVRLHMNEVFPLHAQEAYILFMDKSPEKKRMMIPVNQAIYERYKQFWKVLEEKAQPGKTVYTLGEEMRKEFGDTYWWYNVFGRKPISINGNISHEVAS
ncbi:MAG: hypothetical protein E7107_06465 [Prevotella sp.]|jgi:hypothetical protein|nr:hypothetical protein [Prevotella sp.]